MNLNISIYNISLNLVTWLYDGGLLTKIPVGHLSYYSTLVLILLGRAVKAMWCGKATSS